MAVTIDGTNGITSPDFEPSSSTTPTNGLFLPAANAVGFATNSTERLRLDASGNLGLGVTPSAWRSGEKAVDVGAYASISSFSNYVNFGNNYYTNSSNQNIYKNTAAASVYYQAGGQHIWLTAPSGTAGNAISFTQAMTLTANGNLLIGTTTENGNRLAVSGGTNGMVTDFINTTTNGAYIGITQSGIQNWAIGQPAGVDALVFTSGRNTSSAGTERARIDSSGNLLVGTTSSSVNARTAITQPNDIYYCLNLENTTTATTPLGIRVKYTASGPNNAGAVFLTAADNSATRFELRSNGGLANFSANNVNLSDERVKTAITPAPSWIAKINAIEVVNFKYKDQTHDDPNLGVIAQQVLSVAPELVDEEGFGETPDDGVPLLSIYETDLMYGMLKAIQELTQRLEALENK